MNADLDFNFSDAALPAWVFDEINLLSESVSSGYHPQVIKEDEPSVSEPHREEYSKTFVACVRCKQLKMACNNERPCRRCVRTGRDDECVDSVPKRGGRPFKQPSEETRVTKQRSAKFWAILEGRPVFYGPFATACLVVLKQSSGWLSECIAAMKDRPPITTLFTRFLEEVHQVKGACNLMRAMFHYSVRWITVLGQYCTENNIEIAEGPYRFLALTLFHKAPLYCVEQAEIEEAAIQLGLPSVYELCVLDRTCEWVEQVSSQWLLAPIAIVGLKYKHGVVQSAFVNNRLLEVFGYTRDDMMYLLLTGREDLMVRFFASGEWETYGASYLSCLLSTTPECSRKGVFIRSDGSKFDGIWNLQLTFDDELAPATVMLFITPMIFT